MRAVTDRHASIQVLVNHHSLPSERVAPACLFEWKDSVLDRNRVVLVHGAFVLHTENPIQIGAPTADERAAFLCRRDRKLGVELGNVFTPQELVGSLQIANPA